MYYIGNTEGPLIRGVLGAGPPNAKKRKNEVKLCRVTTAKSSISNTFGLDFIKASWPQPLRLLRLPGLWILKLLGLILVRLLGFLASFLKNHLQGATSFGMQMQFPTCLHHFSAHVLAWKLTVTVLRTMQNRCWSEQKCNTFTLTSTLLMYTIRS